MKTRKFTSLLMIFFLLTILTACGLRDREDVPGPVVDAVEGMNDDVKENIKDTVNATDNSNQTTSSPTANATDDSNQTTNSTTANVERISEEEAENIALKHAGFTVDQVNRLRTSYEVDDGIPEYEVDYYYDNMEYEYTIHAETGEILSYDWDN